MTAINNYIPPEQLLAEIEDLLRIVVPRLTLKEPTEDNFAWQGRAAAVIRRWDMPHGITFDTHAMAFASSQAFTSQSGYQGMLLTLHTARADLRMRVLGPKNIAIGQGQVFDYFDELRKAIEPARQDIFFVDPYLDAEFVSRYMPHAHNDALVRLLTTSKSSQQLLPAIEAFCSQSGLKVQVRVSNGMHDRYLFIDRAQCYQSGASFKDGAKKSPTTFTQITDAFGPVLKTYEDMWAAGTVVRA